MRATQHFPWKLIWTNVIFLMLSVIVTMLFFMSLAHYINVINNASFRGLYYDFEFLEYNSAQF